MRERYNTKIYKDIARETIYNIDISNIYQEAYIYSNTQFLLVNEMYKTVEIQSERLTRMVATYL